MARSKKQALVQLAKDKPCLDCGGRFHPAAMEFDHCRGEKLFILSKVGGYSIEQILAEIKKCDAVCANCHRVRTWDRSLDRKKIWHELTATS